MSAKLEQVYVKMADNPEEYQTTVKLEAQMSLLTTVAGKLQHYVVLTRNLSQFYFLVTLGTTVLLLCCCCGGGGR